jgi:hypothetical protein
MIVVERDQGISWHLIKDTVTNGSRASRERENGTRTFEGLEAVESAGLSNMICIIVLVHLQLQVTVR